MPDCLPQEWAVHGILDTRCTLETRVLVSDSGVRDDELRTRGACTRIGIGAKRPVSRHGPSCVKVAV